MDRLLLSDAQWERIANLFPKRRGDQKKIAEDHRLFIEAVFWITRTGAPWRDLPPSLAGGAMFINDFLVGPGMGRWERIKQAVAQDPDLEQLLIDSTIIRAHQHSAGAEKKTAYRPLVGPEAV